MRRIRIIFTTAATTIACDADFIHCFSFAGVWDEVCLKFREPLPEDVDRYAVATIGDGDGYKRKPDR